MWFFFNTCIFLSLLSPSLTPFQLLAIQRKHCGPDKPLCLKSEGKIFCSSIQNYHTFLVIYTCIIQKCLMRWTQEVSSHKSRVPELLHWSCRSDDIKWQGMVGMQGVLTVGISNWQSNVISVYTVQAYNQGAWNEKSHSKGGNEMY